MGCLSSVKVVRQMGEDRHPTGQIGAAQGRHEPKKRARLCKRHGLTIGSACIGARRSGWKPLRQLNLELIRCLRRTPPNQIFATNQLTKSQAKNGKRND